MAAFTILILYISDNRISHYCRFLVVAIELEFRAQYQKWSDRILFVRSQRVRFVLQFVRDTIHGYGENGIRVHMFPNVGFARVLERQSNEDEAEWNL